MGGRPMGLMFAFLSIGDTCYDKENHWEMLDEVISDTAFREANRNILLEDPAAEELFKMEFDFENLGASAEPP